VPEGVTELTAHTTFTEASSGATMTKQMPVTVKVTPRR
jgi:hypothetical protein